MAMSQDAIGRWVDANLKAIRASGQFTITDGWEGFSCVLAPELDEGEKAPSRPMPVLQGFCYVCCEQSAAPGRRRCHRCNKRHWKAMKRAKRKAA